MRVTHEWQNQFTRTVELNESNIRRLKFTKDFTKDFQSCYKNISIKLINKNQNICFLRSQKHCRSNI